jgi:polyisoprenoid-binding protein YceI
MKTLFPAVLLAAAVAAPAQAQETYLVDKGHSDVVFQVRHLVSKVSGQFRDFEGSLRLDRAQPEKSSVEFTIAAGSIDTNLPDRDTHLRNADFLDTEKHPRITFRSTRVAAKGEGRYEVTGALSLRGVTREVTLPVQFLGFVKDPWGNEKAGFEATLTVNRKDFGIVWNKALDSGGVVLGDEVKVAFNLETTRKKEAASR